MFGTGNASLDSGRGHLKSVRGLNGVCLIKQGINGTVEFFAIVDSNAAFLVNGQPKDHLSSLSDEFNVPDEKSELLCDGPSEILYRLGNVLAAATGC